MERTAFRQCRVTGGLNPFDFSYRLDPGEQLETPPFFAGFTDVASARRHEFFTASSGARLARWQHARLRPVLYNSWEATEFNVDEAGQMALAEKPAGWV